MSDTQGVSAATGVAGRVIERGHMIRIREAGLTGMIALRGDLASPAMAEAVRAVTGAPVPAPLRVESGAEGRAVWMSPDELLLITAIGRAPEALAAAEAALSGQHAMALDLSDARVVFRLSGATVPEVLAKGSPVDLREAAFPVSTARRTHLGGIAVGIWRLEAEEWEVVCFRSLAHHLADWLAQASASGSEVGHF
ncbi:sarcosine oxidase subunit gamma [Limibaculum sp. FT325]|uniref:sarcosine oxidase subunit gamma n=1 Tax=Thermohalobaculum sediminis TaxID=2939436 RepID=UPI0020BFB915|nr:sarcosine oxidase subunit gamma family protein [Limibaculum sediminis]MCL5777338.1 sarcosine oxidase subunit gamma [Limibaculum sediminis]